MPQEDDGRRTNMADEIDQAPASWDGRLKAILVLKTLLAVWALSALYWILYLGISKSAIYVQQSSFWGQERAASVRIGSLHFSVDGYERFMGTVFHPVLLKLAAIPLVVLVLLLISLAALVGWGHLQGEKAQQEEKAALAARREYELRQAAIKAEKEKVCLAGDKLVGKCQYCGREFSNSTGECPSCSAKLGS